MYHQQRASFRGREISYIIFFNSELHKYQRNRHFISRKDFYLDRVPKQRNDHYDLQGLKSAKSEMYFNFLYYIYKKRCVN